MYSSRIKNKLKFIRRLFSSVELKYGVLLITNRCNLKCSYCWIPNSRSPELTTNEWGDAVDRLSNWGVTHFNILGGEPLLRNDLPLLIQHISSKGLGATLTTNGILLDEIKVIEFAKSGLFMLIVSMDRLDGDFRKKGDIERAISLLTFARSLGIVPVIHCVITSENVKSVPLLASITTEKSIFFSCSVYQAVGGAQSRPNDDLTPDLIQVQKTFSELAKIKRKTGLVRTTYDYMENYSKYSTNGWRCNPSTTKWIAVRSDGALMVCAEWATHKTIFDLAAVPSPEWNLSRKTLIEKCSGCYYECYYSEEQVFTLNGLIQEIPKSLRFWGTVGQLFLAHMKRIN